MNSWKRNSLVNEWNLCHRWNAPEGPDASDRDATMHLHRQMHLKTLRTMQLDGQWSFLRKQPGRKGGSGHCDNSTHWSIRQSTWPAHAVPRQRGNIFTGDLRRLDDTNYFTESWGLFQTRNPYLCGPNRGDCSDSKLLYWLKQQWSLEGHYITLWIQSHLTVCLCNNFPLRDNS